MDNLLGDRMRKARNRAGLTQRELALKLDIAEQTLNKYEKGHRSPDGELLDQIVNITKCDPGWLLSGVGATMSTMPSEEVCDVLSYAYDDDLNKMVDKLVQAYSKITDEERDRLYGIISKLYDRTSGLTMQETGGLEGSGEDSKSRFPEEKKGSGERKSA